MFRIATLSLANRIVVALLTAIVAVFGFLSVTSLKQELIPSIEIPSAAIVTAYPGASPEVVDEKVSTPLESAILGLDRLETTTVTSSNGLSVIRVAFEFGTSTADATEQLNNAVSSIRAQLPADVEPRVVSGSFDTVPIIVLTVSALEGNPDSLGSELEETAPSLFQQVSGVRDVLVAGVVEKRINIRVLASELANRGLTEQDIVRTLESNGLVIPIGSVTNPQGSAAVQIGTRIETLDDLRELPIIRAFSPSALSPQSGAAAPAAPEQTFIGDVAIVSYVDAPVASVSRTNGLPALAVSITKTQDGNSVAVSRGVQDLVAELEAGLSVPVEVVTIFDQAPFIEKSIEDLTIEGLLGLTFAIFVILVFLLSIKSTIITAISIPSSVLITFIGLAVADYSLNILTLGALTIAIGRVVDDSIVVIENINRHLSYGEERREAIVSAVKEVAGAITASTITTVAVFLPIALVSGLVGELFRPFAFTVSIALLASLLVSLTIVPVLAYWFLRAPKRVLAEMKRQPKGFAERQRELEEARERRSWLQRGYVPILNGTKNHPWLTLFASVLILGYTFSLVPQLKTNFIDGGTGNQFAVRLELPSGASFEELDSAAAKLEQDILQIEGIEVVQSRIGSTTDSRVVFGAAASGISMQITFDEDLDTDEIQSRVLALAPNHKGEITVNAGAAFGNSETVDIRVRAADNEQLARAVAQLENAMSGIASVSSITSSLAVAEQVIEVEVSREAAASFGLSELAVSGIVASKMRPTAAATLLFEGEETDIYLTGTEVPGTTVELAQIEIPTAQGPVRLSQLATIKKLLKPTEITSERGFRTATVSLAPIGDDLGAVTADITEQLDSVALPSGVTAELGGAAADQAESFEQLGIALLAAIAIVYIVMVATFGSLLQPLILLISIPFAAIGALGLLLITDTALGVPALIGMLLLVGIVVTNAIVLIDLVNQYRRQGKTVELALIDGARQRLRPILMTALATIFALTPMALGVTGGSGFISQPLAIVVVGGLFSSTLLTLILVPTLYWLLEGRRERKQIRTDRRAARKARRLAKRAPAAASPSQVKETAKPATSPAAKRKPAATASKPAPKAKPVGPSQ